MTDKQKEHISTAEGIEKFRIKVFLVDDQAMIAEAVRRALAEEDLDYHYCQDPTEAIKKAEQLGPTIILQDLVMPDIDGLTMVKFYRANPTLSQVPIIVLSTKEEPEIKSKAFEYGANDYLVKLPDKVELIARIRYHSKAYISQMERDAAFRALEKSQKELAAANKILERLSTLDGLTGIPNRRRFDEALNAEWRRSIRHSTSLSLIMLDIDFFKLYNDSYGHQGGDDCLKHVAKCLEETAKRDTDVVARYGGEEFGIILPETGEKAAYELAEAMRARVDNENIAHKSSKVSDHVTISVGVATWLPEKGTPADVLLAAADEALYKSKENGRNKVTSAGTKS